jgi:prepilin-type N-terminal cleavage/methylation domain-containing protein
MARKSNRIGFTIVELLVVIAIIAILAALLSAGVQKVRERADVTQCQNNLRQMAAGFLTHHENYECYPSGGTYWSDTARTWIKDANGNNLVPADYKTQSWGWMYQILPFIDQKPLWADPTDNNIGPVQVPLYRCPSVRAMTIYTYTQAGANTTRAMNSYIANGGAYGTWGSLTLGSNSMDGPIVPSVSGSKLTGRKENISDGLSNTLLIGEKFFDPGSQGGTCNDDQGWVDGWDNDTVGFARVNSSSNPPTPPRRVGAVGATCDSSFGSVHPTMQAAFCDGSVHSIGFDIDPNAWLYLCRINDGQAFKWSD